MTTQELKTLATSLGMDKDELLQVALDYIVETDNGPTFREWLTCNTRSDEPSEDDLTSGFRDTRD